MYGESATQSGHLEIVDRLFNTVYHRFGLLNFSTDEVGVFYGSDIELCLNHGVINLLTRI